MNKKRWIILIITTLAIALGIILYFILRPTAYYPESIDPRTLHVSPINKEIVVGLWNSDGHIYYRFNPDGTGATWDVDDDITEEEASSFGWEAYEGAFMMTHKMRLHGVVPRYYELDRLNAFDFRFHDTYNTYALEKVEEATADGMEQEQ